MSAPLAQLAAEIERRATELADRSTRVMYDDPFWDDRFGARGRAFASEDARYHVTYLVEALRAGSSAALVEYARWLRSVLATRGMCSRHVAESLARLADAIHDAGLDNAGAATAYLELAQRALRHDGPAGELQDASGPIAAATARALPDADAERTRDDAEYLLSYLADALAFERLDLFVSHLRWADGFYDRRGRRAGHAALLAAALLEQLTAGISAGTHEEAACMLRDGAEALRGAASEAAG